jgi:polysaccharide deacetylase family protein (PEP-CTERM system associated)
VTAEKIFLFTVDVEDWFQVENFKSSIVFDSWNEQEFRVERNTHRILDLLDAFGNSKSTNLQPVIFPSGTNQTNFTGPTNQPTNKTNETNPPHSTVPPVRATFFMLGWIARKLPGLVKAICSRGHEVASHGINHHLCTDETSDALQNDLSDSKKLLEDIIGRPVCGYRAPSFSINDDILKIIEDAGYLYDSSYNSFDKHGRYGRLAIDGFKKSGIACQVSDTFYELPVSNLIIQNSTFKINNWILPWGGGGYFRLLPYAIFKQGIQRILKKDSAYNFYMHPWEVDPDQPRVNKAPALLKFRHYVNLRSTEKKISKMLVDFSDCRFVTCREYLEELQL